MQPYILGNPTTGHQPVAPAAQAEIAEQAGRAANQIGNPTTGSHPVAPADAEIPADALGQNNANGAGIQLPERTIVFGFLFAGCYFGFEIPGQLNSITNAMDPAAILPIQCLGIVVGGSMGACAAVGILGFQEQRREPQ